MDAPTEMDTPENATPPPPRQAARGSLKARLDAAGITDAIFVQLEEGASLRAIVDACGRAGIETSIGSVHALKARYLAAWQSERVMASAAAEGIDAKDLPEAVRGILLSRIGRFAVSAHSLDEVRILTSVMGDWTRASIQERAEKRAAVNDQRKLISDLTKAASRVHDLLGNEDEVKRLRAVVDASEGVAAQVDAIIHHLWGDLFSGAAAEEEAA